MCTTYETNLVEEITKLKLYILTLLQDKTDEFAGCIQNSVNNSCLGVATITDINNNILENRFDVMITHSGTTNHNITNAIVSGYINFIDSNSCNIPEDLFKIYRKLNINCAISSLFKIHFINTGSEEFCNEINCIILF